MRKIIVKVGTSTLTAGGQRLHPPAILELVRQIAQIQQNGDQVILVTSGAIAAGRELLEFPQLPRDIPARQMLAAVGQSHLMAIYTQFFSIYAAKVAQVLLTREDITERKRYLNARNTLESLLDQGIIPIVNENDTVATEEIGIGDNDNLSALVANLVEADVLILLTDQHGLYTVDPRKAQEARFVQIIDSEEIPQELWQAASNLGSAIGTGGMFTKLQAAETARRSAATVVIAKGDEKDVLLRICAGEKLGTWVLPVVDKLEARKRFMLAGVTQGAWVTIDSGAEKALHKGGSLLPVGTTNVQGSFERGEIIEIRSVQGKQIAVGAANYSSQEIARICGLHSDKIHQVLGVHFGEEVIHHNNMTMLG